MILTLYMTNMMDYRHSTSGPPFSRLTPSLFSTKLNFTKFICFPYIRLLNIFVFKIFAYLRFVGIYVHTNPSIGQQIKILECLQHISDGRTDARYFHIPRSALRGRGTIIRSPTIPL